MPAGKDKRGRDCARKLLGESPEKLHNASHNAGEGSVLKRLLGCGPDAKGGRRGEFQSRQCFRPGGEGMELERSIGKDCPAYAPPFGREDIHGNGCAAVYGEERRSEEAPCPEQSQQAVNPDSTDPGIGQQRVCRREELCHRAEEAREVVVAEGIHELARPAGSNGGNIEQEGLG